MMIHVRCHTNLDLDRERWPIELPSEPMRYRDLGWMNSWTEDSPKWATRAACLAANHPTDREAPQNPRSCVTKITCDICKTFYRIDSTD